VIVRRVQRARPGARIGVLLSGDPSHPSYPALLDGLAALGRVGGRGIAVEARFDGGDLDRLPALAAELSACPVDVVAAIGAVHCRAAQLAAPRLPVVFAAVVDPVSVGLVADAERPGGNTTGVTTFDPDEARDGIRLLQRLVPGMTKVAILGDAGVPDALPNAARAAAEAQGLTVQVHLLRRPDDLEGAFAAMQAAQADALVGLGVPFVRAHGTRIAARARAARLPTLFARDGAGFGPLLAYGTSFAAAAPCVARVIHRVLVGERAGNIPIERIIRPEIVVNLELADHLGVAIPVDLRGCLGNLQ
jgi:putative ABC transport system substrate-binding protein